MRTSQAVIVTSGVANRKKCFLTSMRSVRLHSKKVEGSAKVIVCDSAIRPLPYESWERLSDHELGNKRVSKMEKWMNDILKVISRTFTRSNSNHVSFTVAAVRLKRLAVCI